MSQPPSDSEDVADRFRGSRASTTSYLLSMIGAATARRFALLLEEFALAPREYAILGTLRARTGISQAQLGEHLGIDSSSMTVVIDRLESAGLVERRRDPDDRRRYALHATDTGSELYAQAHQRALALNDANLAPLNPEQRVLLHEALMALAAAGHLSAGLPDMPPRDPPADRRGAA
jgi:DNA-binding MarR family transcriptional regulator